MQLSAVYIFVYMYYILQEEVFYEFHSISLEAIVIFNDSSEIFIFSNFFVSTVFMVRILIDDELCNIFTFQKSYAS